MKLIFEKITSDKHFKEILSGSAIAFSVKIVSVFISLFFNILLARKLGVVETGNYFLAFSVLNIAVMFGRFGTDKAQLIFVANYASLDNWLGVLRTYILGILLCLGFSIIISIIVYFGAEDLANHIFGKPQISQSLKVFSFAIIPIALLWNHVELFKAVKKVLFSTSLQSIVLIGLVIIFILSTDTSSSLDIIKYYTLASFLTLFLAIYFWLKIVHKKIGINFFFPKKEVDDFLKSSYALFLVSLSTQVILWTPILLLGIWGTEEEIGKFGIANKIASLILFFQLAINTILAPKIAEFISASDFKNVEKICQKTLVLILVLISPIFCAFFIFPDLLLGLFGKGFEEASLILKILVVGYLFSIFVSPMTLIFMMNGMEKTFRNITFFTALIIVVLNLLLIPKFGVYGAAVSFSISTLSQLIIAFYLLKKKLNINIFPVQYLKNIFAWRY